jgi:integrase
MARREKEMIYRRGKVWWFEFSFEGQRIRESAKTRSKPIAEQAERQRRRELELGVNRIMKRERVPLFKFAAEQWLAGKSATSAPLTGETYGYFVRSLVERFGNRLVSDIDHRDIAELQRRRLSENKSARTVNLEISTLRQILRAHGLWGPIGERVKHLRERHDVGQAISREDEQQILDAIRLSRSPALLPLFVLALDTGLRRSELRALRLRDLTLKWQDGIIRSGSLCVPQSKTEAGQGRVVPLTRRACSVVSLWLSRFPELPPDAYLFPAHKVGVSGNDRAAYAYDFDSSRPAGEWKKAWSDALRTAGLRYRWHDCRHSFITRLAENPAVSEETIRALAGHVSRKMLERYSHIRIAAKQVAIQSLEDDTFDWGSPQNLPHFVNNENSQSFPISEKALN